MATYSAKSIIFILIALLSACTTSKPVNIENNSDIQLTNSLPAITLNNKIKPKITRISAVGDIMLGGTAEPLLNEHGYDYPFEQVSPLLHDSNIVIGNLEGPLLMTYLTQLIKLTCLRHRPIK